VPSVSPWSRPVRQGAGGRATGIDPPDRTGFWYNSAYAEISVHEFRTFAETVEEVMGDHVPLRVKRGAAEISSWSAAEDWEREQETL